MDKYNIAYEEGNIIIYDTPSRYIFTTTCDGLSLEKYIAKGSMTLEEIIKAKYDIEYDLIASYR